MSPEQWGPPVWTLFHTLAQKVRPDRFSKIKFELVQQIVEICKLLPCPDCSRHATNFWRRVNFSTIKEPKDLQNILYVFHNSVNKRKHKRPFLHDNLQKYANYPIIMVYNHFIQVFHTRGNMKMLAESFQRERLIGVFKEWMIKNIHNFQNKQEIQSLASSG
jgi:hypothetical protein